MRYAVTTGAARRRNTIATHSRPVSLAARFGAAIAIAAALLLTTAPAARATDPIPLHGAYVVDETGVIGNRIDAVMESLDSLADVGVNLFVIVVDHFTGVGSDDSWAASAAELNRMGDRDILFAIAVVDRNYDISYPEALPLTDAQLDRLQFDVAAPALRNDDYAGAVIAYADAMREELQPEPTTPTSPGEAGGTGGIPVNWPIVGGVVAIGGGAIYLYSRSRRRKALEATKLSQKELDVHASRLLVQLDDQVKTSEQDLAFASAEFGDTAISPFAAALDGARSKLREAFEIRQRLDDAFPETDEEKRTLTLRIVELCEAADAELDAQADAFDELRELEKNAPAVLEKATQDAAATRSRIDTARARLTALTARYSAQAVAAITANPDQAQNLIDFADTHLATASEALGAGQSGAAAVAVHTAQASLGQAIHLLDAIDGLESSLTEAATTLAAVVDNVNTDLAAARALPESSNPHLTQTIAEASSAVAEAATSRDPLTTLAALQSTAAKLDAVLEAARARHEHVQAATRSLDHALATARAEIAAASDYITTRRGGIGDAPRTRVSEAMRHLDAATALAVSDPVTSLAEARAASALAQNALASAQAEVQAIQSRGGYSAAGGGDIGGAILGGIIGSMLGGGGSSRPSSGTWGAPRTPRARSSSSSRSRSGSFGGSSRRPSGSGSRGGRRSSGGRF